MGAVPVDVDPLHLLGINVAGNVIPPVNHQAALAGLAGLMGKYRA